MALVSLKKVHEHEEAEMAKYPSTEAYGYGTEIYLNGEQCEALGIADMRAGQSVMIKALAIVKRSTEELEAGDDSGGKDTNLCMQITDIEVSATGKADSAKAASMLYGDDE